jgi:Fur family transcriptional regulator, zinc uptake regulator
MTRHAFDLAASPHDHTACIDEALARADRLCEAQDLRLTPLRRQVLAAVWRGHRPRGAYDIIEDLAAEGRRVAPLSVYRALDFLRAHGLVHRLESLNAFVGCPDPDGGHAIQFLVCRACGAAAEMRDAAVARAIRAGADAAGFTVEQPVVEVRGLCPRCRAREAAA